MPLVFYHATKFNYMEAISSNSLGAKSLANRLLPNWRFRLRARARVAAKSKAAAPFAVTVPIGKRLFDIVFALTCLLCLLPLFIVVAVLIKLESRGPAFYYSYRVGTGYRVFRFWKFRSMRQDADKLLANMKDLNQYQAVAETTPVAAVAGNCACALSAKRSSSIRMGKWSARKNTGRKSNRAMARRSSKS